MKKWENLSSLGLLDDQQTAALPERAWEDLTSSAARTTAQRTQVPPKNQSSSGKVVLPAQSTLGRARAAELARQNQARSKVFSSRPTLRQMMDEYNRPRARTSPIKSPAPGAAFGDFRFESVDLINIPIIPGKILRPSR